MSRDGTILRVLAPDQYGSCSDPTTGIKRLSGLSLSLILIPTPNIVLTALNFQKETKISVPLYVHARAKLPIPGYLLDKGGASQVGLFLIVQFLYNQKLISKQIAYMACLLFFAVWNINSVKPQNSSHDFVCIYSASMCVSLTHSSNINYISGMESFFFCLFLCMLWIEGLPAKRAYIGFWPIIIFCRIELIFGLGWLVLTSKALFHIYYEKL